MPKVNLTEVVSIGDPLLSDNYELLIPTLPDGVANQDAASRSLRIQCRTAIKPGTTIEEVLIEVFGHTLRYAGKRTVTGSMSVEYVENNRFDIYTILEQWSDVARTFEEQGGATKDEYSVTATFIIYDQSGTDAGIIATYDIIGCWPKTVPDLN